MDCAKDNVCPRVMWRPDPKTRTKQDEFREKVVNGTHDLQIGGRQQIAINSILDSSELTIFA